MSQASYATTIFSTGAPVPVVDEPTANTVGNSYQITDAGRRLLDPNYSVTAYDTDDDSEIGIVSIDFFNGVVTLTGAPVGDVEIAASYLTRSVIGGSNSYDFEIGGDIFENTSFDKTSVNGGYKTRGYGLHDITISVSRFDDLSKVFRAHKLAREAVYIEVTPSGSPETLKGWFIVETNSLSGDIGSQETEDLSFNLAGIENQQGAVGVVFSFS
jgi:hypothetical protein